MTTLSKLQEDVGTVRMKLSVGEDQLGSLRSHIGNKQGQLSRALRQGTTGARQAATLQRQIQQLQASLAQSQKNLDTIKGQLAGLFQAVREQPWDLVQQLPDALPFLLLPVRLEARFMTTGSRPELRVRIYPDDIAVHSHESGQTASELADGQTFWREMWAAEQETDTSTRENKQQGAWAKLAISYGSPRAAWIANQSRPASMAVTSAAALVFPVVDPQTLKPDSWSRAPRSHVMPDRFVILGYRDGRQIFRQAGAQIPDPLILGPDPQKLGTEYKQQEGELQPGPDFAWVSDFAEAVAKGMAMHIPLDRETAASGVDRLLVMGLRLSSSATQSQTLLEELLDNHHFSSDGLSILPQGTPTNNTDGKSSGFSGTGLKPAETFATELGAALFEPAGLPADKTDAQRLAEALGVAYTPFQHIAGAGQRDGREAQLLNTALFPTTGAYYLEEMLNLDLATIATLRTFFLNYVTARGPLPAIRVGNQPYGVLLSSNFAAWKWSDAELGGQANFLNGLVKIVQGFQQTWRSLTANVARLGAGADPYQDLINTLGQNPTSIEFYRRHAMGWETIWNYYAFRPGQFRGQRVANDIVQQAATLLGELGITFPQPPPLFRLAFFHDQDQVLDPLVDDIGDNETENISENRQLKAVYRTPDPANPGTFIPGNYLSWLATCAYDDLKQEKLQDMVGASLPTPHPLLYRMLRSAVLLSVHDVATRLYAKLNVLPLAARREIEIANIDPVRTLTRWELLDAQIGRALPALANTQQSVGDWLLHPPGQNRPDAKAIDELRQALQSLAGLPTARLERIFVEHLDLLTYRLDAWQMGCFARRLETIRVNSGAPPGATPDAMRNKGLYLGAFGWLEDLRPAPPLRKADLTGIPASLHDPQTGGELFEQQDNGGFIHAPSLNQAVAAAVLRSAYLTHFDQAQPEKMAINLSSTRVRTALSFLDGVRGGQELGALLGYQFERGLHDGYNDPLLNQYIPLFRKRYPLIADKITPAAGNAPIETKEARNVLDGYALAETVLLGDNPLPYPYDVQGLPANPNSSQALHIKAEVARLAASLDAIADVLLAEGVYQVTQGNFDRAGSSVKTLTEGGMPPDPEIVKTPRSGAAIQQRVSLHLPAAAPAFWPGSQTQRSLVEPALNRWLGERLPAPDKITFRAGWSGSPPAEQTVASLSLQPIDLVLITGDELSNQETELEKRLAYVIRRAQHDDSLEISFEFMSQSSGQGVYSLFELLPLLRRLRNLVTTARPLSALDYNLPSEVNTNPAANLNPQGYDLTDLNNRVQAAANRFTTALTNLAATVPLDAQQNPVLGSLHAEAVRNNLMVLSGFGLGDIVPQSAFGDTPAARQSLASQALRSLQLGQQKLANATSALSIAGQTSLPAEARVRAYRKAAQEILGSTFNLIPHFKANNPAELQAASAFRDLPAGQGLLRFRDSNPLLLDEWLHGAARVRPALANLEQILILSEIETAPAGALKPLQLPFRSDHYWVAGEYPSGPQVTFSPLGEFLSVIQYLPGGSFTPATVQSGLLVDEWSEVIPTQVETTGIAVHYNQPSSQPPQTVLLAVTPELTGSWNWAKLEGILNDTLDRTKQRAVEPGQLDHTAFGQLLPAVIAAVANRRFATISTDLIHKTSQVQ